MGTRKSQINEFLVGLLGNVLADVYACFPSVPRCELDRDIVTINKRIECEGFEFATKTLPLLGKSLDRALETGTLTCPSGFRKKTRKCCKWKLPAFMSAIFSTIFASDGTLEHGDERSVACIRQVCYIAYKLNLPFSSEVCERTLEKFEVVDGSLQVEDYKDDDVLIEARSLLHQLFKGFDPLDIKPMHGPGAVADRLTGRDKYRSTYFNWKLDCVYPYATYISGTAYAGIHEHLSDMKQRVWVDTHPPARVVLVPKDSRGPRLISCEPAQLQYLQQGLGRSIVKLVESHYLTKGNVNFTDQTVNRKLAMVGSKTRLFSTLDMKDASDRVSLSLVRYLFEDIYKYLDILRSDRTELPNGKIVNLRKFAPMGSALCFPIEALTFWALTCAVIGLKTRCRASSVKSVFVYGDDIIVPTEFARAVVSALEKYQLLFNTDKCNILGHFRESCGCDAFHGIDVTPVRLRVPGLPDRGFRSTCYRLSESACGLFDKGYWRTSEYLWSMIESRLGVKLPCADSSFPGIARKSSLIPTAFRPNGWPVRWNKVLQRKEVKTFYCDSRKESSPFPSSAARLCHNLFQGMVRPYDDCVAVLSSPAPSKTRWVIA